ncbi:MAG TPA: transcription repressor NadR [Clostridia bacterium]|nr:transcription repressor NadR [Clostridia bacterium]
MTEKRREDLLKILRDSQFPVKGSLLAEKFKVSRQVIVQDIAILRARNIYIMANSNGYYMQKPSDVVRNIKTIFVKHGGFDEIEKELQIIVDMGAKILDVIVMHPIYGEIRCPLEINSRYDLNRFLEESGKSSAAPLSTLTNGEHIHTIEVPNDMIFKKITEALDEMGILEKAD